MVTLQIGGLEQVEFSVLVWLVAALWVWRNVQATGSESLCLQSFSHTSLLPSYFFPFSVFFFLFQLSFFVFCPILLSITKSLRSGHCRASMIRRVMRMKVRRVATWTEFSTSPLIAGSSASGLRTARRDMRIFWTLCGFVPLFQMPWILLWFVWMPYERAS